MRVSPPVTSTDKLAVTNADDAGFCGYYEPSEPGFGRLKVYAQRMDCRTARRLSGPSVVGDLVDPWDCAGASGVSCTNTESRASFTVVNPNPPGEQVCPLGQVPVGEDSCAPQ